MNRSWKLASVAAGLIVATALTTGITTAYLMDTARTSASTVSSKRDVPRRDRGMPSGATVTGGSTRPTPVAVPAGTPRPTRVAYPSSTPADCGTTGDRIWRIAKPGALGGLLGAGVGAAGGAIADGGSGAGKGALIGGLVGAAAGSIYGGYTTKQECGTIFAGPGVVESREPLFPEGSLAPQAALQHVRAARATSGDETITVYRAR